MSGFPLPPGVPALYPQTNAGFTAPTLGDWQFEFNGLQMGAGTNLGILKIEGMGALPAVGSQDIAFPRDTGEWLGVDAMAGRDVTLDLWTSTAIYTQFVAMGAATAVNPYAVLPLWFQLPDFEVLCSMCRPRKRPSTWDANTSAAGEWIPTVTLHANDPRLYGQGQVASAPASGTTSTSWSVDNTGNCEMRPVLILTGPLTGPSIVNESLSGAPAIAFQSGVSIASGDQVAVDLSPLHLVSYYVGGIASPSAVVPVYNWLDFAATTWWNLPPGANDLTATVASGTISDGQFAAWYAAAYML